MYVSIYLLHIVLITLGSYSLSSYGQTAGGLGYFSLLRFTSQGEGRF